MPLYRGMLWASGEVIDLWETGDIKNNIITEKWQVYKKKINRNFGKIAGRFPNKWDERDFKISGMSDQILGPTY